MEVTQILLTGRLVNDFYQHLIVAISLLYHIDLYCFFACTLHMAPTELRGYPGKTQLRRICCAIAEREFCHCTVRYMYVCACICLCW